MLYSLQMDILSIKQQTTPIFKKYGVTRASVFGSAARGDMNSRSDIDLLVELPVDVHGFNYVALKVDLHDELSAKLGKSVDLVEFNLIKPDLQKYILTSHVPIL